MPMITSAPRYILAILAAADLYPNPLADKRYRAVSASVPVNMQGASGYEGISLDPQSDYPGALCFFDGETIGVPLYREQVIVRKFRQLRVAPLYPAIYLSSEVVLDDPVSGSEISPGKMWLRFYEDTLGGSLVQDWPPQPRGAVTSLISSVFTSATGVFTSRPVLIAPISGAKTVSVWGGSENELNPCDIELQLAAVRCEVAEGESVIVGPGSAYRLDVLSTPLTIPNGVASYISVGQTVPDVGANFMAIVASAQAPNGALTFRVGMNITWR